MSKVLEAQRNWAKAIDAIHKEISGGCNPEELFKLKEHYKSTFFTYLEEFRKYAERKKNLSE